MSTDAWIEEHWIGEAVLPRPRRAPKLPALQVPHAPTCSRGNAALAAHAQSRDRARHPGDGLNSRQNGRNVVDQQARKLTQPLHRRSSLSSNAVHDSEGGETMKPTDLASYPHTERDLPLPRATKSVASGGPTPH